MIPLSPEHETEKLATSRRASRRTWSHAALHWIRRIHLYSGLFLFPWVMLYGVTALLFNHPDALPDQPGRTLSRDAFAGTALAAPTDPAADAAKVVGALNARFSGKRGGGAFRLVEAEKAVYSRALVVARARGPGQEHSVLLDLPSGTAFVSSREQSEGELAPFATRGLKVPGSLAERVKAGLPAALAGQGLAADDAGIAIGPELVFLVEADGRLWRATYHPQTGAVAGRPADTPSGLSTRRFLTQLHVAHGYSSQPGIKWLWALVVDVMFAAMVFWGLSGLFMWWQIKAVRIAGALVLLASLLLAAVLAIGMHRLFTPL